MSIGEVYPLPAAYLDAFYKHRVSQATTIFDYGSEYDAGPLFWETQLTGGALSTHTPNRASVALTVTTAQDDEVIRQQRAYNIYQKGKSQRILGSFVLGEAVAGVRKRIGYFDASDGVFLEQATDGTLYIVRRSSATGTPVDVRIPQSEWNLDKAQGERRLAPRNFNFGPANAALIDLDFEWLGVGQFRVALVNEKGAPNYVHRFENTNVLQTVYMRTGSLPLRMEMTNVDGSSSAATLEPICFAVQSEGGFEEGRGIPFARMRSDAAVSVTTQVPLLSIRPAATYNSIVNRMLILPTVARLTARSKTAIFRLVYGGTLTNASWQAHGTHSAAEYDVSATAITGGIVVDTIPIPAASQGTLSAPGQAAVSITSRLPMSLTEDGSHPTVAGGFAATDSFTITAATGETPDATLVHAGLKWEEIR